MSYYNYDSSQCQFKGNFLLYKNEPQLHDKFDQNILNRYGGFLRLISSNTSVQLKVRVYIIKATKLNPIRDNGSCDPFLSVRIGDKVKEEPSIPNTLDPVFGK